MSENEPAITVSYLGRDQLRIEARGHVMFADQPVEDRGDDTAATPTEIFLSGLAACVAFYGERFLRRHELAVAGLTVGCDYFWAENPHRVGAIVLTVDAPGLPAERREAFAKVIEHCTVHNTLVVPPQVQIRLTGSRAAVA
jgi:putative redox protein